MNNFFFRCLKQYNLNRVKKVDKKITKNAFGPQLYTNIAISHFNCYFQSQNSEFFVLQLNSIDVGQNQNETYMAFDELKIFTVNNTGAYYYCIRSEDISNYKVFIKRAESVLENGKNTVSLLNETTIFWSTNFHYKLLLLVRDIIDFANELQEDLSLLKENPSSNSVFNCMINGCFSFHIKISDKYSAKVSTGNFSIKLGSLMFVAF